MNEYQICIAVGGCIAAFVLASYVLCWIGQWVWAWVDDSEIFECNVLIYCVMVKALRYESSGGVWDYIKDTKSGTRKSDGLIAFALLLSLSAVPLLSYLSFVFYQVFLCTASVVAIAYLARFARRHKKLFDKHVKNEDAHKRT